MSKAQNTQNGSATLMKPWSNLSRGLGGTLGPLLGLLLVVLFFWGADVYRKGSDSRFGTARNFRTVAQQTSTVAVAALGMTVIIIAGGIDLSAGTALALCATVLAYGIREKWGIPFSLAACVLTGGMTGLVNGALISALRVVPFIVTLGSMTIFLGIAKLVASETTVRPGRELIPQWLSKITSANPDPEWLIDGLVPNVANGVWIVLLLATLLGAILRYTVFGRHVFALGSSEPTARLCGINVPVLKIAIYTLGGLFIGLAGIYQFSKLSVGNPTSGLGQELKIIAAVVIGGGSLRGGRGSILGTLAGAAMMGVIDNGCTLLGLKNPIQDIIIGVIIVAAVTLDQFRQRRLGSL